MSSDRKSRSPILRHLLVHSGRDFRVTAGANVGEPLLFADALEIDDRYILAPGAKRRSLAVAAGAGGSLRVAARSATGRAGNTISVDCVATLMSDAGQNAELLLLAEIDAHERCQAVHVLPLSELTARLEYQLVGVDRDAAWRRLADLGSAAFVRGTLITAADGTRVPVESLRPGDRVLTRNNGPQPVLDVRVRTVRAEGPFAPLVIRANTLNNARDLVISPDHRLFFRLHDRRIAPEEREVVIRAGELENGDTVFRRPGGYLDYIQLIFACHQIVYAEGIAADAMFPTPGRVPSHLPRLIARLARSGDSGSVPAAAAGLSEPAARFRAASRRVGQSVAASKRPARRAMLLDALREASREGWG